MVGLRTRTEVSDMIPDNSKRPDVVYTRDSGRQEIIADVVTCLPVLMSATTNICAHSAITIGAANTFGITSKHRAWNPRLLDLPYKLFALAHEPGRISDPAQALLDNLIMGNLSARSIEVFLIVSQSPTSAPLLDFLLF